MKRAGRAAAWILGAALSGSAHAQPEAPADPPDPARLDEAKALFQQGNALRKAGDCLAALGFYQRSRALVPSISNTLNAAVCLDELGRHDQAFEMYEVLVTEFAGRLSDEDLARITPAISRLMRELGTIEMRANVAGELAIDGRPRGVLPLLHGVRVLAGRHTVHVIEEGYEPFEETVDVAAGTTHVLDAHLAPLRARGRLRVIGESLRQGELFVDGARVGTIPWEGTLRPGTHVVHARTGAIGTAPLPIAVVENQTVTTELEGRALGPVQRIRVEPPTAQLWLDGVALHGSAWAAPLPIGRYALEAREPGYEPETAALEVEAGDARETLVRLAIDEDHPRWGAGESGSFWLEAFGGASFAPSIGGDLEAHCDAGGCADEGFAVGPLLGARAGYEIPFGLSFELAGGYFGLRKAFARAYDATFMPSEAGAASDVRYALDDAFAIDAGFAAAGLSYRFELSERVELRTHLLAGPLLESVRDPVVGTATVAGGSARVVADGSDARASAVNVLVLPELTAGMRFDRWRIDLGLAAAWLPLDGPSRDGQSLRLVDSSACTPAAPAAAACVPDSQLVAGERVHGPLIALVPRVGLGFAFEPAQR